MGGRTYVLRVAAEVHQFMSPDGDCAICAQRVGWGGQYVPHPTGYGKMWSGLELAHHRPNALSGRMEGYQRKHLFIRKQVRAAIVARVNAYRYIDFLPLCASCHEKFDQLQSPRSIRSIAVSAFDQIEGRAWDDIPFSCEISYLEELLGAEY